MKAFSASTEFNPDSCIIETDSFLFVEAIVVTVCWDWGRNEGAVTPWWCGYAAQRPLDRNWMDRAEYHCNATDQPLLHPLSDLETDQISNRIKNPFLHFSITFFTNKTFSKLYFSDKGTASSYDGKETFPYN